MVSHQLSTVNYAIWVIAILLHMAIAFVMFRRRLLRVYPCFFLYTAYHALHSILGLLLYHMSQKAYFWFYWSGEAVDAFLTFLVLREIFKVTFAPYPVLRKFGLAIFNWVALGLCLFAAISAVASPDIEADAIMAVIFVMDRSIQLVELGLVLFLFAFCNIFGMTWRNYAFGIAVGMAVIASIGTLVFTLRAWIGQSGNPWFVLISPLGFTIGNAIFAYYFASRKSEVPLSIVPRTDLLIAWNQALSRVH